MSIMTEEEIIKTISSSMYLRMVVTGVLVHETDTHYITETSNGTTSWSKKWYRLMPESK